MKSMQKSLLPVHENTTICNAVIDTNVLVSAVLKWESLPGHIMQLAFCGTLPTPKRNNPVRVSRGSSAPKISALCQMLRDISAMQTPRKHLVTQAVVRLSA